MIDIARYIEIPGIYLVYTLLSTWPDHHPSPWPTHPHQAPTNHGQCTGMHSALVGHTCTTINCNFCKLAFTPQGAPPCGQICPCSPCAPPRQAPVGHKLQAPKLVYTNSQFLAGGGYILGIYWLYYNHYSLLLIVRVICRHGAHTGVHRHIFL